MYFPSKLRKDYVNNLFVLGFSKTCLPLQKNPITNGNAASGI